MNPNKRLLSLDVLRGITVAGMILVNNTGKCGYNFAAFAHAKWMVFRRPIWYSRCLCS